MSFKVLLPNDIVYVYSVNQWNKLEFLPLEKWCHDQTHDISIFVDNTYTALIPFLSMYIFLPKNILPTYLLPTPNNILWKNLHTIYASGNLYL